MRTLFFLKLKLRFLAQQKTRNGVFRPPPGSWIAPLGIQIDPRVSADAVDVRNGLHQSARPQADVDKKTEFSLLKKRSEILVPLAALYFSVLDKEYGKQREVAKLQCWPFEMRRY